MPQPTVPVLRYSNPEEAGMRPDRIELLRARAASWASEGIIPSLVLLAARRGRVFLHEAWGQARPDGQALRTDSVFPVSSISKVVVATLAMKLLEEGSLGLNRPLRFYLPELEGEGTEAILVHHLLNHTSGFDQAAVDRETVVRIKQGYEARAPEETQHPMVEWLLGLRWSAPVSAPPGSRMLYADHNFLLLGEVLRRVSGRSLEGLVRETLFDPLGMEDSWFEVPESASDRVVLRPPEAPQPLRLSAHYDGLDGRLSQETPWANGGMFSTAENLAKFAQMFLTEGASVARGFSLPPRSRR